MNYYGEFKTKLELGQKYEVYVKQLFEDIGWEFVSFNNDKNYDILMIDKKGRLKQIEVKSDNQTAYTHNMYLEYKSWDKPSGIDATTADYFVYVMPTLGEIWYFKTEKLRQKIKQHQPENETEYCWSRVRGGDGKKTYGYLWNRESCAYVMGNDLRIIRKFDIP